MVANALKCSLERRPNRDFSVGVPRRICNESHVAQTVVPARTLGEFDGCAEKHVNRMTKDKAN